MGTQDLKSDSEGEHLRAFMKHLLADTRALEQMIEDDEIESDVRRIGGEQEMVLIDPDGQPSPKSMEVLECIADDHFTTELAKFNIECNLDPLVFGTDCLRKMEEQLNSMLLKARKAAQSCGKSVSCQRIVLNRSRIRARRRAGVLAQARQAAWAEATALPTSSRLASATVPDCWPVAGLKTGWLRPDDPATRWLSMKCAMSLIGSLPRVCQREPCHRRKCI